MSECIRVTCLEHRRDGYWNIQDQAWVHTDGWPCKAAATVSGPPEQSVPVWAAPDGTCWVYVAGLGWTGWRPGEEESWVWGLRRFRKLYPGAPDWDRAGRP